MAGYIGESQLANVQRSIFTETYTEGDPVVFAIDYSITGGLDIFLNGVHLDPDQYIANNGTEIEFQPGDLIDGDKVTFIVWSGVRVIELPFILKTSIIDPTVTDDHTKGYTRYSRWINTVTPSEFVCLDNSVGSAVWMKTTPA